MIGQENLRGPLNQSDPKLQTTLQAVYLLHFAFSLACDDVIDSRWNYFSFGFSTSIVKLLLYKTEINQPTDVSAVVFYCKFLS